MGVKLWATAEFAVRQRKAIRSQVITQVFELIGTKNLIRTTYHPQFQGPVESFNQTLLNPLRSYVLDHSKNCDLFCELITYGYSSQVHSTTIDIPFEVNFPRTPPTSIVNRRPEFEYREPRSAFLTKRWPNGLKSLVSAPSENMRKARRTFKANFDHRLRRSEGVLRQGLYVFIRKEHLSRADGATSPKKQKLSPVTEGPCHVVEVQKTAINMKYGNGREDEVSRENFVIAPATTEDLTEDENSHSNTSIEDGIWSLLDHKELRTTVFRSALNDSASRTTGSKQSLNPGAKTALPQQTIDVILRLKENPMENVVKGTKNHEYPKYLLPQTVKRVWFYTLALVSAFEYVAQTSHRRKPSEVTENRG